MTYLFAIKKMFFYCVVVFLVGSSIAVEPPTVKTNLGNIMGYHKKSFDGRTFSAFEGIPYAKPPVGELRFEAPVDADPWTETLEAKTTYECSQLDIMLKTVTGTEDCLYLNVYVPKEVISSNDNLDVIVHVHGGAFIGGSTKFAGPVFLMDRDVIFVNFNYRLGPLGFLSTEDDVVPGNNGMKDQVLALKWIQKNIKQFGGNPNSVTLTGASAGGVSVHLHYFSKLSKGLFHRGISTSGSALAPWAIQEGALEKAKVLGAMSGCDDTTSRHLIDCLKTKPVGTILGSSKKLSDVADGMLVILFTPIVEKSSNSAFLEDYPLKLLDDKNFNDLPWIASVCKDEGSMALINLYRLLHKLDQKFDNIAHYYLDYNYTSCASDRSSIAQNLRKHYFDGVKVGKESYRQLIKLYGDRMFNVNFEKSTRTQASAGESKVYSFIYEYRNSFAGELMKMMGISDIDFGVSHAEDAQLLYDIRFFANIVLNSVLSEEDKLVKNMLIDMYVTFARGDDPKMNDLFLQPTDINPGKFTYASISGPSNNKIETADDLFSSKFWESLSIIENRRFDQDTCKTTNFKTEL